MVLMRFSLKTTPSDSCNPLSANIFDRAKKFKKEYNVAINWTACNFLVTNLAIRKRKLVRFGVDTYNK